MSSKCKNSLNIVHSLQVTRLELQLIEAKASTPRRAQKPDLIKAEATIFSAICFKNTNGMFSTF